MKTSFKAKLLATSIITFALYSPNSNAGPVLDPSSFAKKGANVTINNTLLSNLSKAGLNLTNVQGVVSGGGAIVAGNGVNTVINQTANNISINWTDFSSNKGDKIVFDQPSANSLAINHVTSGQQSMLMGELDANGRVVIQNDAGITFGAGSVVNVGSLTATTAKLIQGNATGVTFGNFTDNSVNFNGTVKTLDGGYVLAMAKEINVGAAGSLNAEQGQVSLESGAKAYQVDLTGTGKVLYDSGAALETSGKINVMGAVSARSGDVIIRAKANDITSGTINLSGVVDTSVSLIGTGPSQPGQPARTLPIGVTYIQATGDENLSGSIAGGNVALGSLGGNTILNNLMIKGNNIAIGTAKDLSISNDSNHYFALENTSKAPGLINLYSGGNMKLSTDMITYNSKGISGINLYAKGNADVSGYLSTVSNTVAGGDISITAGKDMTLTNTFLNSSTYKGQGGNVKLNAGAVLQIDNQSHIETGGVDGNGGNVTIAAYNSALINGTIRTTAVDGQSKLPFHSGNVAIAAAKELTINNTINTSGQLGGNITLVTNGSYLEGTNAAYNSSGTVSGGNVLIAGSTGSDFGSFNPVTGASNIFASINTSGPKAGLVVVKDSEGYLNPKGQ